MDDFRYDQNENNGYNNFSNGGYTGGFGGYSDPEPGQPMQPDRRPASEKKKKGMRIAALVLACAVAGAGAGFGGAALYGNMNHGNTVIQQGERPKVDTVVQKDKDKVLTPEELYAANLASTVGITVSSQVMNIFGQVTTSAASGSGFVLTQDGYIVTNNHVIEPAVKDPSVTIEVAFQNGDKYPAKLVGAAKDNDVAVIKIQAEGLQAVTLGDSSQLVVGEPVYAIGNPLGELTYTLTDGMVSALDRIISTSESATLNMLQTNCAINPGNSGGPLFDSYGHVIGITTAKYTQSSSGVSAEGLSFAIPINDVKDILKDLVENGYVKGKPYLGVQLGAVSDDAQRYGVPAGAVVMFVAEDSAAEKAGLQVDDIIIKLDDTAIDSPSALTAALSTGYKAGQTAKLTVIRQQEEKELSITFDEKNEETVANNQLPQEQQPQPQPAPQQPGGSTFPGFPFSIFPW